MEWNDNTFYHWTVLLTIFYKSFKQNVTVFGMITCAMMILLNLFGINLSNKLVTLEPIQLDDLIRKSLSLPHWNTVSSFATNSTLRTFTTLCWERWIFSLFYSLYNSTFTVTYKTQNSLHSFINTMNNTSYWPRDQQALNKIH